MKCPVCNNVDLLMSERQGIEIDYCPTCRGVWLDRGELDKIIERASQSTEPLNREVPRQYVRPDAKEYHESDKYRHRDDRRGYDHHYKKKKQGFLGELFDFD